MDGAELMDRVLTVNLARNLSHDNQTSHVTKRPRKYKSVQFALKRTIHAVRISDAVWAMFEAEHLSFCSVDCRIFETETTA